VSQEICDTTSTVLTTVARVNTDLSSGGNHDNDVAAFQNGVVYDDYGVIVIVDVTDYSGGGDDDGDNDGDGSDDKESEGY